VLQKISIYYNKQKAYKIDFLQHPLLSGLKVAFCQSILKGFVFSDKYKYLDE